MIHPYLSISNLIKKTCLFLFFLFVILVGGQTYAYETCLPAELDTQMTQESLHIDGAYVGDVLVGEHPAHSNDDIIHTLSNIQHVFVALSSEIKKTTTHVAHLRYTYTYVLMGIGDPIVYMQTYGGSFNMIGKLLILPRREDAYVMSI